MHSTLFAPNEANPTQRTRSQSCGFAGFRTIALLLLAFFGTVVPGFAQTWLSNLTGSGFNGPTFVALDTRAGVTWLYVSEHGETDGTGGGRILRFNLTTNATTPQVVATSGTGNGQFLSPDAILVDSATGDLFISDRFQHRIQRLSVNQTTGVGTFVMGWGTNASGAPDEMHGPIGLARDAAGAIYVSEHGEGAAGIGGNFVSKYTVTATTATRVWRIGGTGSGNGEFATPYGIAINGSGDLFISDGFNARVQRWSLDGVFQSQFSVGSGVIPLGLFVDASGALWVAESNADFSNGGVNRITRRTSAGVATGMQFGTFGVGNGQFRLPFHAVTTATRAYVADYANDRVQVWDLAAAPAPDTTAPTISSFTANTGSTTATSFAVTFSEPVTGVTNTSFTANTSSGVTATIGAPTGSGANWTVPVTFTGAAGGTISLTARATGSGIIDAASNAYAGGGTATSQVFTIPSSGGGGGGAPSVTSFAYVDNTTTFALTFNQPVTGVDASDFELQATGNAAGSGVGGTTALGAVTGSGANYTVNFTWNGSGPGSIYVRLRSSGTGITGAGGAFAGAGQIETHVPIAEGPSDTAAPLVTSFTAGAPSGSTVMFTLNFDESVRGLDNSDITLAPGSAAATIGAFQYVGATGASYQIPVTYTASSGTIGLVVSATGGTNLGIRDGRGNTLAANATSTTFTIGSSGGGSAPTIANQTIAGTVGTAVNYQVVATDAVSFALNTGSSLPPGLAMSTAGVITGSPTAAGSSTTSIRATNPNGSTNATLTFNIAPSGGGGSAPTIANQTIGGTVGTAVNYQVVATGAASFALNTGSSLPAGLTMSTSGVITGSPTVAGSSTTSIRATNPNGSTNATLTFNIAPSGGGGSAPTIGNQTTSGVVGTVLNYQVVASGATSFSLVSGAFPAGLSMSSAGVVSGTPSAVGSSTAVVRATNTNGSNQANVSITIVAAGTPPSISNQSISGNIGGAVNYQVVATGSPTFSLVGGSLPTGLSISSAGVVTGTPSVSGTFNATIRATNATGSSQANLQVSISSTPAPTTAPTIANQSVSGAASRFLDYRVVASGATTFSIVPPSELPHALSLSTDGRLAGIPTTPGTTVVTVKATNSAGSTNAQLTISISAAPPPVTPPPAKTSQTITFVSPVSAIRVGTPIQLGATTTSGLPITYTVVSGNATLNATANGTTLTPTSTAALTVRASQAGNATYAAASTEVAFGSPEKASQTITVTTPKTVVTTDASLGLTATASSGLPVKYTVVSGPAIMNGSVLTPTGDVGIVVVKVSQAGNENFNAAADVDVWIPVRASATSGKVLGLGNEVGVNIVHQNGNVYDQVLLTGDYATITADAGQVTRISFLDLNDDIVQVEFSGAGALSLVLENPSNGPVAPIKYNQSGVMYMKGHASIMITGADETTNVSVFSVGKATAVNQALFPAGMTYDAIADIGLITISSANGKFGGVRTANAGYFRATGMTGIHAPGVTFTGPVYVGDINASANATGVLFLGSATEVKVTGGDLLQLNTRPILVNGITQLSFTAGTKSNGQTLAPLTNQASFQASNGLDVTSQIIR